MIDYLMPELQLIMYEFQEWEIFHHLKVVLKNISVAHLLNLYQFSNARLQLGVNILQSAPHLIYYNTLLQLQCDTASYKDTEILKH